MGCNCKNKTSTEKKPTMVKANNTIQIIELEEPPYQLEEVQRVRDYFLSRIKTESERNFAIEWNKKYFEPQQSGYCDAPCTTRIQQRAEHAYNKIQEYVNWKTGR